jgi:hypothetical protein
VSAITASAGLLTRIESQAQSVNYSTPIHSCRGFPSAHIYVSERPRFRQRRDLKLQSALIELEHIGGLRFDLAEES